MTKIEIVNLALYKLGERQPLANLDGTDPKTLACVAAYPVIRDALLTSFPWPFATSSVTLMEAAEEFPKWVYAYVHPASALRVLRVYCDNTQGGRSEAFMVQATPNGARRRILANIRPAYCDYTVAVTDEAVFPPLFCDVLAYGLAAELAMPLTSDPDIFKAVEDTYNRRLANAATMAAREAHVETPAPSRYMEARR